MHILFCKMKLIRSPQYLIYENVIAASSIVRAINLRPNESHEVRVLTERTRKSISCSNEYCYEMQGECKCCLPSCDAARSAADPIPPRSGNESENVIKMALARHFPRGQLRALKANVMARRIPFLI